MSVLRIGDCLLFVCVRMAEQIISNALREVVQELRVQGLTKHVRNFHGEGAAKLSNWLKDMEQLSATCDDQRMCVLATLTLGGSAGTFVSRVLKENPQITWQNLKIRIKERYSELTDPLMAREKCRHLKQKPGESVQNFAERINATAYDAFDDIRLPHVQVELVDMFQRGVSDDRLARNLIRKKFQNLEEAVKYAGEEQRTDRTFELFRHTHSDEPMEVDVLHSEGKESDQLSQLQQNMERLSKQMDKMSRQIKPQVHFQAQAPPSRSQSAPRPNQRAASPRPYAVPKPDFSKPPPTVRKNPPAQTFKPGNLPTGPSRGQPNHRPQLAQNRYQWTENGRPICARCGIIGHIHRNCRVQLN